MNADEITKAIEDRIAEIDARTVEFARERSRLAAMLAREEAPTRIELPPMPDVNYPAAKRRIGPGAVQDARVIPPMPYPPPHVPGVFGARPEPEPAPAPIGNDADRNAS